MRDLINAMLRADELEQSGHWVRVHLRTPVVRAPHFCRVWLEWGSIDGAGINQKPTCTQRFYGDGTNSKHFHL